MIDTPINRARRELETIWGSETATPTIALRAQRALDALDEHEATASHREDDGSGNNQVPGAGLDTPPVADSTSEPPGLDLEAIERDLHDGKRLSAWPPTAEVRRLKAATCPSDLSKRARERATYEPQYMQDLLVDLANRIESAEGYSDAVERENKALRSQLEAINHRSHMISCHSDSTARHLSDVLDAVIHGDQEDVRRVYLAERKRTRAIGEQLEALREDGARVRLLEAEIARLLDEIQHEQKGYTRLLERLRDTKNTAYGQVKFWLEGWEVDRQNKLTGKYPHPFDDDGEGSCDYCGSESDGSELHIATDQWWQNMRERDALHKSIVDAARSDEAGGD